MREFRIFPEVTTSKKEFIEHIRNVCRTDDDDIDKKTEGEWINHIENCDFDGHYFLNLIHIKYISANILLHEIIHHISQQLNILTDSNHFWKIDELNDKLYIAIFKIIYK